MLLETLHHFLEVDPFCQENQAADSPPPAWRASPAISNALFLAPFPKAIKPAAPHGRPRAARKGPRQDGGSIPPDSPLENINALMEAAEQFSA